MAKHKKSQSKSKNPTIASNRKARHDYHLETRFEAGLVLEGWEVKSIREGKVHVTESYVILHQGEVWLHGTHITPLLSASTHIIPNPTRTRKLLLNEREIIKLFASVERKGYTIVPLSLYWKHSRVKVEIALAKGKQLHDKRAALKDRDFQREKQRNFKLG